MKRDPIQIIEAIAERQKIISSQKTLESTNTPLSSDPVQLDFWEDGKRAAPNAIFRSALFPALNPKQKENRKFIEEKIFSVAGLTVFFTGKQFDQSDLDVYLELLNMARPYPLGQPIKFSAYGLLKALGLTTGGKDHARLHSVLRRLCGGVIEITDHKKRYFGQLIYGGIRDEITLNYEITLNPDYAKLFGLGMWASIDKEQRQALGRDATSKALQAYYSTHVAPSPHKFETLAKIVGLTDTNHRKIKFVLIKAHDHLKYVGFLIDYEFTGDTIKAIMNLSQSQLKHIAKKSRKSRNLLRV